MATDDASAAVPAPAPDDGGRPTLRIAIAGGGIGGLVLAHALARLLPPSSPVELTLYERAPSLAALGAGIGIWPRPWGALHALDPALTESLEGSWQREGGVDGFSYHSFASGGADDGFLWKLDLGEGERLRAFHRADFQSAVLARLPPEACRIATSKRLLSYTRHGDGIQLAFEDGAQTTCDVLVGADGLHSAVRRAMYARRGEADNDVAQARWSGTLVYRTVIPHAKLRAASEGRGHPAMSRPTQYLGKDAMIIAYTIPLPPAPSSPTSSPTSPSPPGGAQGPALGLNVAAFRCHPALEGSVFAGEYTVPGVAEREMRAAFSIGTGTGEDGGEADGESGVGAEVRMLIENAETPFRWAVHTVGPLPSFVDSCAGQEQEQEQEARVCLLGDAAHAMAPFQGSGAGQAIEDACVLAHLLAFAVSSPSAPAPSTSPSPPPPPPPLPKNTLLSRAARALRIYDRVRRPAARDVQARSRLNGRLFTYAEPPESGGDGSSGLEGSGGARGGQMGADEMRRRVIANWEWVWRTSAAGQLEGARRLWAADAGEPVSLSP